MAAVLLAGLLINKIKTYGLIFVTFFSPLIIFIIIKTSFDAYQSNSDTKFSMGYYSKVFMMTLITQLITFSFTLISAAFFARGIIFEQASNLILGNVALILGIVLAFWFEYTFLFVPFLAYENPQLNFDKVYSQSKQLMKGKRLKAFVLLLSFFGWFLLAIVASAFIELGLNMDSTLISSAIVILTLCPYIILSFTGFYKECVRQATLDDLSNNN